jgi:Coenzyme PQQ synthesis protein D (PqqD)
MRVTKLKVRDDIARVEIDGETVIYDPREDGLYHLNPSATIVLQLCDGTGTADDLALDIAEVGGLPLDQVLDQVRTVIHNFANLGILEGSIPRWERQLHEHEPDHEHQHEPEQGGTVG